MNWEKYSLEGFVTAGFLFVISELIVDNPTVVVRFFFALLGFLFWIFYGLAVKRLKCKSSKPSKMH
jgi:hypothetical protein